MKKDILKTFFLASVPFGITMGLVLGIFNGFCYGISSGIIMGFLFGIGISTFVQIQKKKFVKIKADVTNGKTVIMDGGANHFKGTEAVGGWLYLTSEDIIFKSHGLNIQTHRTVIPLDQIIDVKAVSMLGFIPNGLQIITKSGTNEKFVVNNRKTWVNKINGALAS